MSTVTVQNGSVTVFPGPARGLRSADGRKQGCKQGRNNTLVLMRIQNQLPT